MKLQNKIGLVNLAFSIAFLAVTAIALYLVIDYAVYRELDMHLKGHREDLEHKLDSGEISMHDIEHLKSIGSVEWAEVQPIKNSQYPEHYEQYSTLKFATPNRPDSSTYRVYRSTMEIHDHHYLLNIYEEISGWHTIIKTILIAVGLLLVLWISLMYIGNYFAFRKILAPFYTTVQKLAEIKSPETFHTTFPPSSTDEIDSLNKALNRMLDQLETHFQEQKKFLQNASHELLTPLSIIRQKIDVLLAEPNLSEEAMQSIAQMQETVLRISRLSNALLLISKVESKQYKLNEEVSLKSTLGKVLDELQDFIDAKQLTVKHQLKKDHRVLGNQDLLHALFFNIIQNAIKYSPDHAAIEIYGDYSDDHYHLSIRDHGEGIAPEDLPHIFKRFKKKHLAWNESPGLGLSIVKSICDFHDFDYKVDSTPGEGTTVHLYISMSNEQ